MKMDGTFCFDVVGNSLKILGEDSFVHGVFIQQLPSLISFKLSWQQNIEYRIRNFGLGNSMLYK